MLCLLSALVLYQGLDFVNCDDVQVEAKVLMDDVVTSTDERFLSFTMDCSKTTKKGWRSVGPTQKLVSLVSALSPAYLRVGGTTQDHLHWVETCSEDDCYNATQLDNLYKFAQTTNVDLIFALPAVLCRRTEDDSWDSTNAIEMLKYLIKKGETRLAWELGNEPDEWDNNVSPEQLAVDFQQLKLDLKKYGFEPKIYGPDVAALYSDHDYFPRYLSAIPDDVLDAVTWHTYYGPSAGTKLDFFVNVTVLDKFITYFNEATTLVYNRFGNNTPIWLGETSSTYDGGVRGISDSYVAGFMWLDKLGSTALLDHKVVCRQTLFGGHYSLLDVVTKDPLPDYWSSVLYKRLMGKKVLKVENALKPGLKARIYVHCTRITKYYNYKAGAATLMIMNLYQHETIDVKLQDNLQNMTIDQYLLQPPTKNLTSKTVNLNGKLLSLVEDVQLPELKGRQVKQPFSLPPLTYGFYVVPEAKAKACLQDNVSV